MTIYLRFANLVHPLEEELILLHSIDRRGVKLLEIISSRHSLNQSLMTTELMKLAQIGSPVAIHSSLRLLRDSGLVLIFHKGYDLRAKYLCPSDIAMSYYSHLGDALIESVAAL